MESIDKIKRLADIVSKNTAPSSNTNTLIGNLLKAMALYMAEQHHGAVGGYQFLNSLNDLPTGDLTDKQKRTGYVIGENIYFYVGTDGDTLDGEYQNGGSFHGTKGDDGLSAYEIWKAIPGNENKSIDDFWAFLTADKGYTKQVLTYAEFQALDPTTVSKSTIYVHPNSTNTEYYAKLSNGTTWVLLLRNNGDISNIPQIETDAKNDFSIRDEQDNAIVEFTEGHIKTKNFDSSQAVTQDKLSDKESEIREDIPDVSGFPTIVDDDADFSVKDEDGNAILKVENGHIKTKNFDSENIEVEDDVTVGDSDYADLSLEDEDGNSIVEFKRGHIKTKNFDSENITLSTPYIYCIGDSVTQGQSGIDNPIDDNSSTATANCYPNRLQDMVGDKYNVVNLGVGGQKTGEILARNGLLDAIVKTQFILKGDGTTSFLCSGSQSATISMGVIVDSCAGEPINYMLQQGTDEARSQMSRCYINGIQCTLSCQNDGTTENPNYNLYIKRNDVVSYNLTIPVGTHITFGGNKVSDDNAIYCLRMGSNDLSNFSAETQTIDNYIEKIKQSVVRLNTNKWLIVGIFRGNTQYQSIKNEINEKLSKEFGARFIDGLSYISSLQPFYELGITPTTDSDITAERAEHGVKSDIYCIENHITPSSFWRYSWTPNHQSIDNVHLNYDGYYLLAKMFYNKIKELNWI